MYIKLYSLRYGWGCYHSQNSNLTHKPTNQLQKASVPVKDDFHAVNKFARTNDESGRASIGKPIDNVKFMR